MPIEKHITKKESLPFKNVSVTKYKEEPRSCSRLEETKGAREPNAMCDPGMDHILDMIQVEYRQ